MFNSVLAEISADFQILANKHGCLGGPSFLDPSLLTGNLKESWEGM